jgi:hypothetical protein
MLGKWESILIERNNSTVATTTPSRNTYINIRQAKTSFRQRVLEYVALIGFSCEFKVRKAACDRGVRARRTSLGSAVLGTPAYRCLVDPATTRMASQEMTFHGVAFIVAS